MVEATASLQTAVSTRAPAALQTSRSWQLRLDQGGRVEIQCARCGYGASVSKSPVNCSRLFHTPLAARVSMPRVGTSVSGTRAR